MAQMAHIVTKYGMILVNFIEGKQLPFCNTEYDVLLRIVPHQSSSLVELKNSKRIANVGKKDISIGCVCMGNSPKKIESLDDLLAKTTKEKGSLVWLDPTPLPIECLSCIIHKWLEAISPADNAGLGIVIPQSNSFTLSKSNFKAWISTSVGPLRKDLDENVLPVWYPSLNREPNFLEKITHALKPFDVFPIVEFPRVIDYDSEKEIAVHHSMLDRYRTRTRNLIYLNDRSPEEALKTLFGSFEAISRNGKMPRSLLVTPGGTSVSYLTTLLAGVFSGGIFVTPEVETPFPGSNDIWGFAVLKKV